MLLYNRIGCVVNCNEKKAILTFEEIKSRYNIVEKINTAVPIKQKYQYDLIVTIGGDGTMLKTMHYFMGCNIPIYGINKGSLGFLLNQCEPYDFMENLKGAVQYVVKPLRIDAITSIGKKSSYLAINEVSLLRDKQQSAHIEISINGTVYLEKLVGDGVLLATPTGSSAYNFAAHGPIVPLDANVLLLTAISPFRPRRWSGAMLSADSEVCFRIIDHNKRPVQIAVDSTEINDIVELFARTCTDNQVTLLFNANNSPEQRMLKEQFSF